MTRIALLAAGCAALALAACDHPDARRQQTERALKVISKLDCPDKQGDLTRVSAAADGLSCVYSADGAEVTLTLVKLVDGDAAKALAPIEAELRALMPATGAAADKAAGETNAGATGKGESVDIKLPGISIEANDGGARIVAGDARIDATDEGAEVRVSRNVGIGSAVVESERRRGRHGDAVMAKFILASDSAGGTWRAVGYEARGPKGGPLVVGTVRIKEQPDGQDGLFNDVGDLIRHNVGGQGMRGVMISAD